jgi:hypothetical protein
MMARSLDPLAVQAGMSLEWRLTSPDAFALTTASPLQRAICRIIDGRPLKELEDVPAVRRALGLDSLGRWGIRRPPLEVALLAGIRSAKSLIAAAAAHGMSQRCDVSRLGPGEIPRIGIVSYRKDQADVILDHLIGRLEASAVLRGTLLDRPTSDGVLVRHPSGRPIEIRVVAGARAGTTLVARWLAGCIFDEFPRLTGPEDGVVNWRDQRDAAILRLLPGAQMLHIGSPWGAVGPAYDMVTKHWGRPTPELVVLKAPAFDMWPEYWTPARLEEAKKDPDAYQTDVLAEFRSPDEALFGVEDVRGAVRPEAGPELGLSYVASMDPATRGNGWCLGVFTRQGKRKRMVCAREWRGSKTDPLSPREVLRDIAAVLRPYGVTRIATDRYYIDALADIAREFGLHLDQHDLSDAERTERYLGIRAKCAAGEVEFPEAVRPDLLRLRKRVTAGGLSVVLPHSADGRHCDFAPVVMLGLGRWIRDETPPSTETPEAKEAKRLLKVSLRRYGRPKD